MSEPSAAAGSWRERFREVAARMTQPAEVLRQLLGDVIGHALTQVGAATGAVLITDDQQNLRYLAARGVGADQLADFKVPIEGSIAGYVFSAGTMMAFGDLETEQPASVYAEIGAQIGVTPRTYLALPILHGGRAQAVAVYLNRPGPPPYAPFQQAEMEQARQYTVLEGAVLRHLERTWQLERFGAYDLAVAWAALDPAGPDPVAARTGPDRHLEPWARMLQHLERLSQEDQDFCTDLVAFVARRRDWELG